jgi:hypothetical protein
MFENFEFWCVTSLCQKNIALSNPMSKPDILKSTSFQVWRREHNLTFGTETIFHLDHLIQGLDWTQLIGIELSDNEEADVNKTFLHTKLKTEYGVVNGALKTRVVGNISFVCLAVMEATRRHLEALERTRIMPEHLDTTFPGVVAVLAAYTWKGVQLPPRKGKCAEPPKKRAKKVAITDSVGGGTCTICGTGPEGHCLCASIE